MLCWPNARDDESKIIKQFKFLQSHLTTESAVEFCQEAPDCGFLLEMYTAHHLHYAGAFQSYLTCLRAIVPLVSRSVFCCMFAKRSATCATCGTLQFLCILRLHPILENEVNNLFRELLCDPCGDILHRNDTRQLAMTIWQEYKRRDFHFPYIGGCMDFESESPGYRMAQVIGKLFESEKFCQLMKSNPTVGAQIAHEMLKNLQDEVHQSNQLSVLLSKYEKLVSENKLDV